MNQVGVTCKKKKECSFEKCKENLAFPPTASFRLKLFSFLKFQAKILQPKKPLFNAYPASKNRNKTNMLILNCVYARSQIVQKTPYIARNDHSSHYKGRFKQFGPNKHTKSVIFRLKMRFSEKLIGVNGLIDRRATVTKV